MIVNPQRLIDDKIILSSEFTKIQQNGIDLSLKEELVLESGKCKNVFLNEKIVLPKDLCGELKIRSTYSRQGIFLSSGFWDSGFEGTLGCTLYNMSDQVIIIPANERICQFICYQSESASLYKGKWKGI